MLLLNSFQRLDECIKHLSFRCDFDPHGLLIVCHIQDFVCVSVRQFWGGDTAVGCRSHDHQASGVCCQGVCPRIFQRAVELHDQVSLQACLHWHLQRSVLVCLLYGQFHVFIELIWNPLNWDSAHLSCYTVQESNGLNSALEGQCFLDLLPVQSAINPHPL